jgi:acetoin utilization deacetylase AcuC-like enzyme
MSTAYFTQESCIAHDMGAFHPESPARLKAIQSAMLASGLAERVQQKQSPRAPREALLRAHSQAHVEMLESLAALGRERIAIDADTVLAKHSFDAALHAAGACVAAVDLVMQKQVSNAFCAVRPPGHHATHASAMGFCFFNSIAVAALHALDAHGLERVAVIDFDVHHGNGTEDILHRDPRIAMFGFFQHPMYPYSGDKPLSQGMHNTPLPAGTAGDVVRKLVSESWLPALDAFAPQLILISAGFDAHREDDLGGLGLVEADYSWITEQLMAVANKHCEGRIVSSLEGGYNLDALARSVVAHVSSLVRA